MKWMNYKFTLLCGLASLVYSVQNNFPTKNIQNDIRWLQIRAARKPIVWAVRQFNDKCQMLQMYQA